MSGSVTPKFTFVLVKIGLDLQSNKGRKKIKLTIKLILREKISRKS